MTPKPINPFLGIAKLCDVLASGEPVPGRDSAITTTFNHVPITVDTVQAFDTMKWETGIQRSSHGEWSIVEQYPDQASAEVGHEKWVAALRADPTMDLPDYNMWGLWTERG